LVTEDTIAIAMEMVPAISRVCKIALEACKLSPAMYNCIELKRPLPGTKGIIAQVTKTETGVFKRGATISE